MLRTSNDVTVQVKYFMYEREPPDIDMLRTSNDVTVQVEYVLNM
jgi:hypothetical protein